MKRTNVMKRMLAAVVVLAIMVSIQMPIMAAEDSASGYTCVYVHDPRINANAMADIVVNPNAVYGFSPDPDSDRLGEFASYDWTDPLVVEKARQDRIKYLADFDVMYDTWKQMAAEGKSVEEIARCVSTMRNELRLASYEGDPEGLAKVKKSNLDTYGNENGPTLEYLFAKYGSWEKVLIKSFSSNSGMDACVGLYDAQYEKNCQIQSVVENPDITYTVKDGDYLLKIASKYYGSEKKWAEIYNANKNQINGDYVIYVGEILSIPNN